MTFEEELKRLLTDNGMFDSQEASEIMETVKRQDKVMLHRWSADISGYPDTVINVLWLSVRQEALKYIDANCPLAWFRSMFV